MLVAPLRGRVRAFIDRRFYRRKYNAAKTLAGFAAVARDETDLDALNARLAGVVRETMEPETLRVWIGPPAGGAWTPDVTAPLCPFALSGPQRAQPSTSKSERLALVVIATGLGRDAA